MDEDYFRSIRHWLRAESVFLPDSLREAGAESEFPPMIPVPRTPSE